MALEVTDGNIKEILEKNKITVLDFWAPWCGPCKMLGPIIDDLSANNQDITIGKINVDENSKTAIEYGVRNIPTILFFKNGEVIDKIVGIKSKIEFQTKIDGLK